MAKFHSKPTHQTGFKAPFTSQAGVELLCLPLLVSRRGTLFLSIPANHSFCLGRGLSIQFGEGFVDLVSLVFATGV